MYNIELSKFDLIERTIFIIGLEPVYSKQVKNVSNLEYYFNKRFGSSYKKTESKSIVLSLKEFLKYNSNILENLKIPFRIVKKIINKNNETQSIFTGEIGEDVIPNIDNYVLIYDKDSGWIGITIKQNILIR